MIKQSNKISNQEWKQKKFVDIKLVAHDGLQFIDSSKGGTNRTPSIKMSKKLLIKMQLNIKGVHT